ncbi:isoprenyl transferase [Prosthecomicrobium pneumaticum]|nr:isoprenyl transferase [Prosthecomicrobium pneumaticum]
MSSNADPFGVPQVAAPRPPRHVAIIMDGNGRWAAARGLPRTEGHRRGVEALRRTIGAAIEFGIGTLTVFSFSSENWSRPPAEVQFLFGLLRLFIQRDLADLHERGVRVTVIGARDALPGDIRGLIEQAEGLTAANRALELVVAFNYGARDEIARAARRIAEDVAAGRLDAGAVDETALSTRLDTARFPDPDLIVRTSGEMRLSNFLLWQSAYAEFVFTPVLWPDFDRETLRAALDEYAGRARRFGGIAARSGA